ncbi:MAG: hypothetical protein K2Y37_03760 [Pirellulales bacterium]|nr:hypothetical protein [Pirellulales bacterium]
MSRPREPCAGRQGVDGLEPRPQQARQELSNMINRTVILTTIALTAGGLWAAFSARAVPTGDVKRMDEELLCRKLEACYESVKSLEQERGKVFDIQMEKLSYLVVVAGSRARGSKRLDAVFSRIQNESPTLVVPRFVMTPAELQNLIDAMAADDADELSFAAYQRKVRTISELIAAAKNQITPRSGFKFDPSVRVIRTQ